MTKDEKELSTWSCGMYIVTEKEDKFLQNNALVKWQ